MGIVMDEPQNLTENELRDINQVTASLLKCNVKEHYEHLKQNIINSNKPHIQYFIRFCDGHIAAMRSDKILPEPLEHDLTPIDLRDGWIKASAITGNVGSYTLRMVRRWGYRDAMLRQLSKISNIGTRGFITLYEHNCLQYSAEVTMRKYFSHMLNERQIARIDEVLAEVGYVIE
jgi:hypothetical protein